MTKAEMEAVAEIVEAWTPGVAVVGDVVAVGTVVDGALRVAVAVVPVPARSR